MIVNMKRFSVNLFRSGFGFFLVASLLSGCAIGPETVTPGASPTFPAASPLPPTAAIPASPTQTASATPVAPTPVAPTPVAPTPVAPTPVAPTPVAPTPVAPTPVAPTPVAQPSPIPPTSPDDLPLEAIQILQPGPGSRLVGSIHLQGNAEPTFEQSLVAVVVLADGTELLTVPIQIQADMGQRGPFEVEIPFAVQGEQQAFIQVYAASARDGGITHLSAVGVMLADGGEADIRLVEPQPERINIFSPLQGETLSGGTVHVEGYGLAGFEQTLIVEVQDSNGIVIGLQPFIVQAPDLGQPGFFMADVPYQATAAGPGRVVVRDESPAFGGSVHLSSVEINFE